MSAARVYHHLLALTTSPLLYRSPTPTPTPSSFSFLRDPKPPLFHRYNCYIASAQTAIESPINNATTQDLKPHPWPEWVSFVDHLKSQGYFTHGSSDEGDVQHLYSEMNDLKDPCLSFARDRFDIFRSLPKDEIQVIVKGGCPKLHRKVVNSAKRLRVYVGLDEKDVCSVCSLRGSCDRAYVMLKESDGDARTVDLMRILLFYALDPLAVSGAVRLPGTEEAEASARRLLSVFVDLSGASPSVAPEEPPKAVPYQKKSLVKTVDDVLPRRMKLQPENLMGLHGDTSQKSGHANIEAKQGDWACPKCSFLNFSRNVQCLKCKTEVPKQGRIEAKMKKGDWNCVKCGCMNFASRRDCFRCKGSRPPRILEPGEWECPKCDFLNFRRNVACFKCGSERTKKAVAHYEEQFWQKPQY